MSTATGASGSVGGAASSAMVAGATGAAAATAGTSAGASSDGSARTSSPAASAVGAGTGAAVSNGTQSCAGNRWHVRCLCTAKVSRMKRTHARSAIISARDCGSRGARQPRAGAARRRGPRAIWHCCASCTRRSSTRLGRARRSLGVASGGTLAGTSSTSAAGSSRIRRSAPGSSSGRDVPSRWMRWAPCAPSSRTSANGTEASAPADQRSGD